MIGYTAIKAYENQFKDSHGTYDFRIQNTVLYIDGEMYACPKGETDRKFRNRVKRSKEAGENLFKKEWAKV